jgi:predicted RNase H-like HicB family nuclease
MLATGDGADMSEKLIIETDREDDGRWLAEVPALPGTMSYGRTRDEAIARVQGLGAAGSCGSD